MPDPVFTTDDHVPPEGTPDFTGKSPQEVAAYYQQRERVLLQRAQTAIASAGAGAPSSEDFESDPLSATQRLIASQSVSRQEFNQLTQAAQATMIAAAKREASEGKPYWKRLSAAIDQITAGADPLAKLDASFWELAYNTALGQNFAAIQQEERAAAEAALRVTAEPPSGGSTPPPTPRALSPKELAICEGLGITPDQFRRGEENIRTNTFPVTLDNRRR